MQGRVPVHDAWMAPPVRGMRVSRRQDWGGRKRHPAHDSDDDTQRPT